MIDNIKQWWRDASAWSRMGASLGVALIALILAAGFYWTTQSDNQVLFSDLTEQDASALVKELDKLKTPYELANGGTTILVPADMVYKTRLKVMGQNIPLNGGVGFEIFNDSDFGMTEFAQKVNYQRALQGELARTIMAFDEIKFARVHIVMPESGLFQKHKVQPKASVTLIMKPDAKLHPEQITGIQRLVAASVPEIESNAVTILDQQGVALSKNPRTQDGLNGDAFSSDIGDSISQRLDIKKQIEGRLLQKLAEVLDKGLGPKQAIVSVDVSLNYDQIKVTQEDVLGKPNENGEMAGVVVRRSESTRNQPGAAPTYSPSQMEGSRSAQIFSESVNSEVEYQAGRRIEQVISMPGSIKRISVGILVPNHESPEKLQKIKEIVEMTAGIDASRGDAVVIHSLDQLLVAQTQYQETTPLVQQADVQPLATTPATDYKHATALKSYALALAIILGVVVVLMLSVFLLRRKRAVEPSVQIHPAQRERILEDLKTWLAGVPATESRGESP